MKVKDSDKFVALICCGAFLFTGYYEAVGNPLPNVRVVDTFFLVILTYLVIRGK